jgi:hypothetical protein
MINNFCFGGFGGPRCGMSPYGGMSPTGGPGMSGFGGGNPLMAMGSMMQMMSILMTMMGGEMPGMLAMPGNVLMPGMNPGFGQVGPWSAPGMQSFLGESPCDGGFGCGIYTPQSVAAGRNGGGYGGGSAHGGGSVGPSGSVTPRHVSNDAAPGTNAMLQRAGDMIGMHGNRDRDELKKITGRLDPARSPWCAAFAMNMLEQHGVMDLTGLKNRNYCPTIEKWARDKGTYGTPDKYSPRPGDAILFDWQKQRGSTDHIGIVEKVENGVVYTIEGNAGNKVQRRKYKLTDPRIDGYVMSKSPGQPS